jgi:hypothetical protein
MQWMIYWPLRSLNLYPSQWNWKEERRLRVPTRVIAGSLGLDLTLICFEIVLTVVTPRRMLTFTNRRLAAMHNVSHRITDPPQPQRFDLASK